MLDRPGLLELTLYGYFSIFESMIACLAIVTVFRQFFDNVHRGITDSDRSSISLNDVLMVLLV